MGGGGYVAGPVGVAALTPADPARADRGRQPPGPDQPRCSRRSRGACAWRSRCPDATGAATASPGGRFRRSSSDRAAARARFGVAAGRDMRARVRRLAGSALDQPRRGRGVRGRAAFTCCTSAAVATTPSCAARELPAGLRPARVPATWTTSPTRWRPPTWWWRARAARCSRSPRTGCRRSSCPIRTPRPITRRANARWMADAGAAVVIADDELSARASGGEVADAAGRSPRVWRRWPRAARGLARPDAARDVARELLEAACR